MSDPEQIQTLRHPDEGAGFLEPKIEGYLLSDQGEVVVDLVKRHRITRVFPMARLLGAVGLLLIALGVGGVLAFVLIMTSAGVALEACYRLLDEHRQRFVITNMRVFRVEGILSQKRATVPMSRILDITVNKPLLGRIFHYGHFVFESAAQDQGLRDIRFVARPDERDLTIQRVIQRSGLRSKAPAGDVGSPAGDDQDNDDGT